jgi:hypothetical protein
MIGVTWEYENGVKFSFIVCQKTSGIASEFYRAFVRERVKRRSPISNVPVGSMLPVSVQVELNHQAL